MPGLAGFVVAGGFVAQRVGDCGWWGVVEELAGAVAEQLVQGDGDE